MSRFLLIFSSFILFVSCTSERDDLDVNDSFPVSKIEKALNTYICSTKGIRTRNGEDCYSMAPYVLEDDTVMYVAEFGDGWELYSADMRFPIVLLSQETGKFAEMTSIPALKDCVETIASEIKNKKLESHEGIEEIDDSWSWVAPVDYTRSDPSSVDYPDYDHGQWDVIEWKDLDPIIEERDHILTTQWGSGSPWNMYTFRINKKNCDAGTVTATIAQYLFYIHSKIGVPETIPSQARLVDDSTYVYYSFDEDSWENMALSSKDLDEKVKLVAVLIGYVSQEIRTWYGNLYSISDMNYAVNTFLAGYTGMQFENSEFSTDSKILSELKKGNPVIAWGKCSNLNNQEYAFIIDAYRTTTRRAVITYGWNGLMKSGRDPNMRDRDGNIIEYGIKKVSDWSSTTSYYKINWGIGGLGNETQCHAGIWSPNLDHIDINVNKERRIYINKNTALYDEN